MTALSLNAERHMEDFSVDRKYEIWMKNALRMSSLSVSKTRALRRTHQVDLKRMRWNEVYRGARRSDIATQGKAAAEDLHMDMDDRWQRTVWDGSHGSSYYSHDDTAATHSIMSLEDVCKVQLNVV